MAQTIKSTPIAVVPKIHAELKAAFKTGKTHSVDFRLGQLQRILDMINENEDALAEAISLDGKSKREAVVADIITTKKEVKTFMANLRSWLNPAPYSLGLIFTASMDSAKAVYEPLGTVLVIGTWNYPFNTAICPLIGAIGGGNTVALKLSEIAEHTATLLTDLIPRYLDQDVCRVVNGSVDVATELLKLRWDHIFYTGNTQVGKIIAKAAAEHLTTCTLELGGKSPCIIDRNVDLVLAAKRIAYGKLLNCGQTCVAPDYLLIPKDIRDEFLEHFKKAINEIYGEFGATKDWVDYGRIVNERHFQRLKSYLDNTKGEVFLKGEQNEKDLIFGPTVVINPSDSEPLSKDEIFGPILSVIDCESVEHAIEYINSREKPLACYAFSNDSFQLDQVQRLVPAGGMILNDCIVHFAMNSLPFGGVGYSGYGSYHGFHSFKTFTHEKPVLSRTNLTDLGNYIRYPPYTDFKLNALKKAIVGLLE